MRDRAFILGGLGAFLVLITFPVWYNLAEGTRSAAPELKLPVLRSSAWRLRNS